MSLLSLQEMSSTSETVSGRNSPRRLGSRVLLLIILVLGSPSLWAERYVTGLPFSLNFDQNNYSDLLWLSQGATHTWMADGGWRGGAAKFTPPDIEGYSGLGQFIFSRLSSIPEQVNVRFLVYYGPTWFEYGPGGKLFILVREGNRGRPMVIIRPGSETANWETWGACDGTVCRYEAGDYWPDGTDRLRIGDPPNREEQWICFEMEANTRTGMIRLYVDTQDGELSGLYVERYMDDTGPGGVWSYLDIIGGYMWAAERQHPGNYFKFDELVIDSRRIGPPEGFVTGAKPRSPSNLVAE